MSELRNKIEEQVAAAALDKDIKKALQRSLSSLADYQESLLASLEKALESEAVNLPPAPEIITGLVNRARADDNAFGAWDFFEYPVTATVHEPGENPFLPDIFFLKTTYEKTLELFDRKYEGRSNGQPVPYEIVPCLECMEAEKKLDLLWRLYGMKVMRPFSPWARRAVRIRVERPEVDLCLEKNGLQDIFLRDMVLVWNVEMGEEEPPAAQKVAPRPGGGVAHKYYYNSQNMELNLWPLPVEIAHGGIDPEEADFEIVGDKVVLSCRKRLRFPESIRITFHDHAELNMQVQKFSNTVEYKPGLMLQSRGDFNRLLASFENGPYHCTLAKGTGEVITRYTGFHRLRSREDQVLSAISGHPINVRFSSDEKDDLFLTDYANWVLEELERHFPLFTWRGIR